MVLYVTYLLQASVQRFLHSNVLFREDMLCDSLQHTKKENTPRELSQSLNTFSQILSASRTLLFFSILAHSTEAKTVFLACLRCIAFTLHYFEL